MASSRIIKSDFSGLNELVKNFSDGSIVKVGVLGKKAGRSSKGGMTNADIGVIHEFGSVTKNIPARSFLRAPIFAKGKEIAAQMKKEAAGVLAKAGGMQLLLSRIGVACEAAIQQAFATRGFGKWKPIKKQTAKRKGSDAILIQTGQLRRAIDSKVEKR